MWFYILLLYGWLWTWTVNFLWHIHTKNKNLKNSYSQSFLFFCDCFLKFLFHPPPPIMCKLASSEKTLSNKSWKSFQVTFPVDTGRKLNVYKTFRRRPGHFLNVFCTFNLHPFHTGLLPPTLILLKNWLDWNGGKQNLLWFNESFLMFFIMFFMFSIKL